MEVWRNGSQILDAEWDRHQTKWLLALLLSRPGAVFSYDQIIDSLLVGSDPQRGRQSLYALVSRLRRTLQPDLDRPALSAFIVRRGEGYAFNEDAPFAVDTQRFVDLIDEAGSLQQDGRFGEARDRYRQALDLYAGDYLAENPYEDWTLALRQMLRDQFLRALEGLATCQARTGALAAAIATSERLIRNAPHQERGYRQAMYYHYCAGAPEKAESIYRNCVHALKASLDVPPSSGLIDLYRRIRAGTARRLAPWVPHNLPSPITSFIGRETDVAEISETVRKRRLVTLLGPGGIGKTRLAIEVGSRLREAFCDGVWLIDLGTVSRADHVPQLLSKALEIDLSPEHEIVDVVVRALQPNASLLILDSCERVIDGAAQVAEELLQRCPELHVLATSREILDVPGERIWRVPPLDVPEVSGSAEDVAGRDAARLFAERTRLGIPAFEVTEENADLVRRLCRGLDGLPLAIELAASQARALPLADLVRQVEDHSMVKVWESRTGVERLQSLEASIASSYDALPPREQAALRRASVFAGGFDLEAARRVLADPEDKESVVLDWLRVLEETSLLTFDATPGTERYRLLDTIRAFGWQRLKQKGELETTKAKHLGYFASLADRADKERRGPLQGPWLRRLGRELPNLRAALRWAVDGGCSERGLLLTCDLSQLWTTRGLQQEGLDWRERFLAEASEITPHTRGRALWLRSRLSQQLGPFFGDGREIALHQSRADLSEASALFEHVGDRTWWARCQLLLANTAFMSGNVWEAETRYSDVLAVDREIGNRHGEAACLANLGRIHLARGEPDAAVPLLEEALGIAMGSGNLDHEQSILVDLGNLHEARGAYDHAWRLWERGLAIAQDRGDRHGEVRMLVLLAILAQDANWARRDPMLSESYWSRALQAAREAGDVDAEVRVLVNHGEILRRAGEIKRARSEWGAGLLLTLARGTGQFAGHLALGLAEIACQEGDAESAALLAGAVRSRGYALLDEASLRSSEAELAKAIRTALGDAEADTAMQRGAKMGLHAAASLLLDGAQDL
jgi:predicted ATPase/DNA-binding SARP family transcriptional activator